MDAFCLRSFLPSASTGGSPAIPCTPDAFVQHVNSVHEGGQFPLRDGYAPFCKHLFIPNHLDIPAAYRAITDDNRHLLQSTYVARTEKELPVLMRHFTAGSVSTERAAVLDVILYSRQQIQHENAGQHNTTTEPSTHAIKLPLTRSRSPFTCVPLSSSSAMSSHSPSTSSPSLPPLSPSLSSLSDQAEWQWGIVSIKPQSVYEEVPMLPITMMRNALGMEEGGSGVKLDRAKYRQAVEFWSQHAAIQ